MHHHHHHRSVFTLTLLVLLLALSEQQEQRDGEGRLCADGEAMRICVPEDYMKFELPEDGMATNVSIGVDIKDIPKVNDKDFSITLNAYFIVKWRDQRLIVSKRNRTRGRSRSRDRETSYKATATTLKAPFRHQHQHQQQERMMIFDKVSASSEPSVIKGTTSTSTLRAKREEYFSSSTTTTTAFPPPEFTVRCARLVAASNLEREMCCAPYVHPIHSTQLKSDALFYIPGRRRSHEADRG